MNANVIYVIWDRRTGAVVGEFGADKVSAKNENRAVKAECDPPSFAEVEVRPLTGDDHV